MKDWIKELCPEIAEWQIDLICGHFEAIRAENERLIVQLAGCGVAALGNTESSKAHRAKQGDYGYSESYADVCRAVDREIELRAQLEAAQAEATEMALIGVRGFADVAELRKQLEQAQAQMERQKDEWLSWHAKRESLEADAVRYRWLRSYNTAKHQKVTEAFYLGDEHLDAAIDAARAALEGEDDGEDTRCPTCGEEDGGTSCGMPNCGLLTGGEA